MKKRGNSFLAAFLLFYGFFVSAQEKKYITVKGNDLNSGVVMMDVQIVGKDDQLRCNQGAAGCTALKSGRYQIVELPKHFGMYDCRDVEVYAERVVSSDAMNPDNPDKPNKDDRLGEYCLVEKPPQ